MAIAFEPRKDYRLYDGAKGTEYEACVEALKRLETMRRDLDERIELMQRRINIAEGHP